MGNGEDMARTWRGHGRTQGGPGEDKGSWHKVHASFRGFGPLEERQLRVGQRLGQLEDARHVLAVVGQRRKAVVEAVSEGGEQLSASKADSDSRGRSQVRPMFECCLL